MTKPHTALVAIVQSNVVILGNEILVVEHDQVAGLDAIEFLRPDLAIGNRAGSYPFSATISKTSGVIMSAFKFFPAAAKSARTSSANRRSIRPISCRRGR